MRNLTIFLFFLCSLAQTNAQSAYDSLKKVYHAQYVFEQREKGSSDHFIKSELAKISDPELKQLATIAIVNNVYGYGWIKNEKLLALLDDVIKSPASEIAKETAVAVKAEVTRVLINTKIQSISLPDVTGDTLNLTEFYTTKKFIVVDLWATWCGPCIAEMKKFNALKQQYNDLEFYSISLDEDFNRVKKFVSKNKDYTWPIVWAGKGSPLWDYFKARLIPAFVIVDTNGIIVSHIVGKGLEEELKKLYKK